MDPEQLREFEESIRRINEMLSQQSSLQAGLIKGMQDQIAAMRVDTTVTRQSTDATRREIESSTALTRLAEAEQKAADQELKAKQTFNAAMGAGLTALTSFTTALINGEKGFSKFGGAVSGAGDAAWDLGKNFGILGKLFGGIAFAASRVVKVQLEQLDAQIKFKDQFSKMGQISGGTTEELAKLARQAGYSYLDLEKLTKPLQTAGMALQSMNSAGQSGAEAFLKMANVGKETRMRFERLGVSQEELTNMQAEYLSLQRMSGSAFRDQAKDAELLKKKSLEYANQLVELSVLTGRSVEQLQAEQRQARMTFEEAVQTRQESARIRQLENEAKAAGTNTELGKAKQAEADKIRAEQESRQQFINVMANKVGPEMAVQLAKVARTGAFTEDTKGLANLGLSAGEIKRKATSGSAEDINVLGDQINEGIDRKALTLGTALQFGGEELGRVLGVTKEALEFTAGQQGEAAAKLAADAEAQVAAQAANRDKEGKVIDDALHKRGLLTEAEILAKTKLDELISSVKLTDTALLGLAAALGVAILALGQFAAGAGMPGAGGAGGALKTLGKTAGVLGAGYVGWEAGQWLNRNTNIQENLASGIDKATGIDGAGDKAYQEVMASNMAKKNAALKGTGYVAVEGGYKGPDGKTIFGKDLPDEAKRKLNALGLPGVNMPLANQSTQSTAPGRGTISSPAAGVTGGTASGGSVSMPSMPAGTDSASDGPTGSDPEGSVSGGASVSISDGPKNSSAAHGKRKSTEGLIIHHTGGRGMQAAIDTLAARGLGYHYLVDRDGRVVNYVDDGAVAHHAGKTSKVPKLGNRNTIGVSLVAKDDTDITKTQAEAAIILGRQLQGKYGIGLVYGHGETSSHKHPDEGKTVANLLRGGGKLPENMPKAAIGGIFSGPTTGYPVEMHGTELVTRLNPNSLLEQLAKTSAAEITNSIVSNNTTDRGSMLMNTELMQMLSSKLDRMIDILDEGNDTSNKLLKRSSV